MSQALEAQQLYIHPGSNINLLNEWNFRIGITGTREPTEEQKIACQKAVMTMLATDDPPIIVSGFANGIDKIAHEIACYKNMPTIAFLPRAFSREEPLDKFHILGQYAKKDPSHETFDLYVSKGGAVLSQFSPGHVYRKYDPCLRNQTIVDYSEAVFAFGLTSKSKGTLDCVTRACKAGLYVFMDSEANEPKMIEKMKSLYPNSIISYDTKVSTTQVTVIIRGLFRNLLNRFQTSVSKTNEESDNK